ncbi:Collagen-like protein [Orpheovirus IHUMI-LCC2]|uniref:Collagen-like protein n=1 Tax=Orpheovirus IHUMI-LCC2 TaxID=2023057 RepID=A0A2I2L5Q9_9VIRU|nr:Collagen-like protein [Orpheovirus IHUMI-LCC2]SNW62856.1 Collagen-like protein [Orpheovirus IHUMI-LCC2]
MSGLCAINPAYGSGVVSNSALLRGVGFPSSNLGTSGALYVDLSNGNLYSKVGYNWALVSTPTILPPTPIY